MNSYVEKRGYAVCQLPAEISFEQDSQKTVLEIKKRLGKVDWIVLDHYDLNGLWEKRVREAAEKILTIDDCAGREHDCDILLNQNFGAKDAWYETNVPETSVKFIGVDYALLRPQFMEARARGINRDGKIRNILVFLGGADPNNTTMKVLHAFTSLNRGDLSCDVIIGMSNINIEIIESYSTQHKNVRCHLDVENMAEMMCGADVYIGSGGSVSWERCCLGLPGIVITIADNQVAIAKKLNEAGASLYLSDEQNVTESQIAEKIEYLLDSPEVVKKASNISFGIVDGRGSERVAKGMLALSGNLVLRLADRDDRDKIFEWRNDPKVREMFFDPGPIDKETHNKWFASMLVSKESLLLIGELDKDPVGVVRFDISGKSAEISIYLLPEKIGCGLGLPLVRNSVKYIFDQVPDIQEVIAKVLPENIGSVKTFIMSGFKKSANVYKYRRSNLK